MSNTQKLDNDVLMAAVLFANQYVGVGFAPYQLKMAFRVLRGTNGFADQHWCDHVRAYYHGAMLGRAAAKQQHSGQVEEARTTAMDVVAVHDEYERLAAIGYAAEKTTYDKINDTRHYPWDNLMPHVQSSKIAFTRAIIAELTAKTTALPTADDFLAVWAPRFGVMVHGRAESAALLVRSMVAPALAALNAQIAELQAKLDKSEHVHGIHEPIGQQFVEFIEKRLGEFGFTIKRPDSIHWAIIDEIANCWIDMVGNANRVELQREFGVGLVMELDVTRAKVAELEKHLAVQTHRAGRLLTENKAAEKALDELKVPETNGDETATITERIKMLRDDLVADLDPTPTEDDEVKYAVASMLDESKHIGHYQNMSRKGLVAAVLNLSHDVNVIAAQRDHMMRMPSVREALNAVRDRVINELDNKRDDVGHYRVREVDVVKVIDEAIGASTKLTRDLYKQLVDEDLVWLLKQPQALERNHIETIVRASVDAEYPYARATTAPPCGPCQGSGKLWCSSWERQNVCAFCNGSGRRHVADNSKQQSDKYDVVEEDRTKRAQLVAECLNERGVLRGHGHPKAWSEFVNGHHMVRFTARMSSIVDMLEQDTQTIAKLALEIEESDEAYRRGRELMQQARK